MKFFCIIILACLPFLTIISGDWKLVWTEEFNYTGLPDPAKWNFETRGNASGWGNNELQYYTSNETENAYVSDGSLKITALKKKKENREYTSARITTEGKGEWKYCKVEVRAKLPGGLGTWPAIWMMPARSEYGWPECGEIDIMEQVGYDPYVIHSTIHTQAYNHLKGTQVGKQYDLPTAVSDFHLYGLEWDNHEIRSFVDGVQYFSYVNDQTGNDAWPFDQSFYLILNLAIGGNWGGQKGVNDALFPHVYEIDYVRIYQKTDQ